MGEVDAIDEGVVTSDSPGISEQLIFEADLDPAITARARTIYGVDWGIAGKIAKESIDALRLCGGRLGGEGCPGCLNSWLPGPRFRRNCLRLGIRRRQRKTQ